MGEIYYTTIGSVRGGCGHRHRSEDAAERCVGADRTGRHDAGGYSDRYVVRRVTARGVEVVRAAAVARGDSDLVRSCDWAIDDRMGSIDVVTEAYLEAQRRETAARRDYYRALGA